ncbi:uncharacterized protein B0H18DRAFT_876948 [Fomitopsis serialis]|uniref:uncharacterized protein n=1 Tax=Fomitopsis serialis TaxID=139415 RepID=UPI00200789E6|nr:uncharacterized protein B0H18DRAFT_876948 [Neoantrodia serialis]KAH9925732.1 hypothetical protein B0H18DRAFT_876948 [Neoantrodia serialis]
MSDIRPESQVQPSLIPPLDTLFFNPSLMELEFLHEAVSADDGEMRKRILEVQKDAKYPYPCILGFHHVALMMSGNPIYPAVLKSGKRGDTVFLDLGCCMGTDVRKLVHDGYPAASVLGCDLRQEYIDLGYKLYRDQESSSIRFFTSDIFDVPLSFTQPATRLEGLAGTKIASLSQLIGSLTHIYIGAVFHLFDEATQYAIALRLATLLKRERGAVIFGRHRGLEQEGMIDDHLGRTRYGHSERSWPVLWKKVFTEAESAEFAERRVKVEAKLSEIFWQHVFGKGR